jgi:hypothetical protein
MSSSCLIHLTLHRLHSLLSHVSNCSPNDLYVHTMLQMYTSRASSALSQAHPALAFSAKSLIQYSCLQRNPFLPLIFSDPRQRKIAWGGCLLWCTGVKRVSNFEITAPKCGPSSAVHSAQHASIVMLHASTTYHVSTPWLLPSTPSNNSNSCNIFDMIRVCDYNV